IGHALYSTDAAIEYAPSRLKPQHALASAAIPIIFPTVRVSGRLYVDGSVRQNTPISPAIRLGCERVLVIGLRLDPKVLLTRSARRQGATEQESLSSPLYLFGKLLDALLLDRVENDLGNLRRVNAAQAQDPSDLLSYLLFDGEYAHELIGLGERDAQQARGELEEFLAAA